VEIAEFEEIAEFVEIAEIVEIAVFVEIAEIADLDLCMLRHFHPLLEEAIEMNLQLIIAE